MNYTLQSWGRAFSSWYQSVFILAVVYLFHVLEYDDWNSLAPSSCKQFEKQNSVQHYTLYRCMVSYQWQGYRSLFRLLQWGWMGLNVSLLLESRFRIEKCMVPTAVKHNFHRTFITRIYFCISFSGSRFYSLYRIEVILLDVNWSRDI